MTEIETARKELEITEAMGDLFANALMSGHPATVACVDSDNKPQVSHRGTLQRLNNRQLAMWARNPNGGIVNAVGKNPNVAVLYSDFSDLSRRAVLNCSGRAYVDLDEDVRRTVYDNSPEFERQADPDRKGVAIVIDVDEIKGYLDGAYVQMERDLSSLPKPNL